MKYYLIEQSHRFGAFYETQLNAESMTEAIEAGKYRLERFLDPCDRNNESAWVASFDKEYFWDAVDILDNAVEVEEIY